MTRFTSNFVYKKIKIKLLLKNAYNKHWYETLKGYSFAPKQPNRVVISLPKIAIAHELNEQ